MLLLAAHARVPSEWWWQLLLSARGGALCAHDAQTTQELLAELAAAEAELAPKPSPKPKP